MLPKRHTVRNGICLIFPSVKVALSCSKDSDVGTASSIIDATISRPKLIWTRHTSLPRWVYFHIISFAEEFSTIEDQSLIADRRIFRKSFWCNLTKINFVRPVVIPAVKPKNSNVLSVLPQFRRISNRTEASKLNCGKSVRFKKGSRRYLIFFYTQNIYNYF